MNKINAMKTKAFLITVGMTLLYVCHVNGNPGSVTSGKTEVKCSSELLPLTSVWVSTYNRMNQNSQIILTNTSTINPDMKSFDQLTFITGKAFKPAQEESIWSMVVARDVIVPVINSANPFLVGIGRQGVSSGAFEKALVTEGASNWGTLLRDNQPSELHLYALENEMVRHGLEDFLNAPSTQSLQITWLNESDLLAALKADPLSIGFCKLNSVCQTESQEMIAGLQFLPIDKNGNGRLDYMENIYSDVNTFLRGVWIGKYPKSLVTNVYAVCSTKPSGSAELAFLQFILSDDRPPIASDGYVSLTQSERESQLGQLLTTGSNDVAGQSTADFPLITILIVCGILLIAGVVVVAIVRNRPDTPEVSVKYIMPLSRGFDDNGLDTPGGLLYDKSHMWAFMEKDGSVLVGVDDFIQHVTGAITRVILKKQGEQVKKGELMLSILQSGKMLNLYAPVSGTVAQQNEQLVNNSSLINSSPYSEGWVYKIKPTDWLAEARQLISVDRYKIWLRSEFLWLKDFLALVLRNDNPELTHLVLQDGGVIREGVLSEFGPEVWEDFQTKFLDAAK
ncbi:MAG: hypothetical protein CVU06_06870 [Bacteroidetes bacterium HGW-Bacteroidetes-22]|nr:MAG: hypothetical protein CVU06_06870 [Bacteroidetes bacterium HGW-Bacteroidetes-22]